MKPEGEEPLASPSMLTLSSVTLSISVYAQIDEHPIGIYAFVVNDNDGRSSTMQME